MKLLVNLGIHVINAITVPDVTAVPNIKSGTQSSKVHGESVIFIEFIYNKFQPK
jgi:hypothetical protein